MRPRNLFILAATVAPLVGAGVVFAAFDGTPEAEVAPAPAPVAAVERMDAAPEPSVRRVDPYDVARANGSVAKSETGRLPVDGAVRLVRAELPEGMAVVVRENGDEGEILMTVDPERRLTELSRGSDLPRVTLEGEADGARTVTAAIDRDAAREIVLEAIASRADMAQAIFFRDEMKIAK